MVGLAKFANFIAFGLGTIPDFDPSPVERILNLSPKQPVLISQRTGVSASTPDEDADFVRRTLAGELDAFDVLIRRHQQRIYRTLMAITRNKEDAEDGVQNVFLKAFQHLAGFQGASKFATWLTRIALNEGSERLRARKDFDSLDLEGPDNEPPFQPRDIMAWQANPEELYSKNELRHQVELGLLKLPVKYRIVVMLRDLQQLTAEETTEILQIGIPAMKSRLLRGRLMLRDALAPTLGRSAANV
jgi:RNA polymerase sigma-70 factor (ECF subfamily)